MLFAAGIVVVVIFPGFTGFVLGLILASVGKYAFDPSVHAYLGERVPFERRGQAIAAVELGWSLSFLIGVPTVGFLIARGGWLAPFPLIAFFAVTGVVIMALFFPRGGAFPGGRATLFDSARTVFRSPVAVAGLLMGFFVSAANELVSVTFGVWLEQSFGLQLAALAGASFVIGISELLGETAVGAFTDRLGKPRAVALGILLNCAFAILLPVVARSAAGAFVGLFLFYVSFEFTLVSSIALMTELSTGARATLMGINVTGLSLGRALGDLIGLPFLASGMAVVIGVLAVFNLAGLFFLRRIPLGGTAAPGTR